MAYSREHPSPRYRELIKRYREEHKSAKRFRGHKHMFDRASFLREVIEITGAKTMLDYGCGKGVHIGSLKSQETGPGLHDILSMPERLREILGISRIYGYDPGYPPFASVPRGLFDIVVSFDVLEHIPEEDLVSWVIEELFTLARKVLVVQVACYPSSKRFDGSKENQHVTVQSPEWWREHFDAVSARHPKVVLHLFPEMKKETMEVVTSFSPAGYEEYGRKFLESFCLHWPKEVGLRIYYEGEMPAEDFGREIVWTDLLALPDSVLDFMMRYGDDARLNEIRKPREIMRYNALKFCRKTFALYHAGMATKADLLFWCDADVLTFAPVSRDFLASLLPIGNYLCCLDRMPAKYTETGFLGFRTSWPAHSEFMERYVSMYRDGKFFEEQEWHDCIMFDAVRMKMEAEGKIVSHNLSPGAADAKASRKHPWGISPLATCMDHLKGVRKSVGSSWKEDVSDGEEACRK